MSVQNGVAELDVDIVLEDGPDSVTIQAEQYQQLVDLKKADPSIPTAMVIEASQLRNKDKLLEMMKQGGVPPEIQQQMQGLQEQLQQAQQDLQACQQQLQQAEQQKGMDKAEAQAIRSQINSEIKVAEATMSAREAQLDATIARWEAKQAHTTAGRDAQDNQGS
jgi:predicted  nucleic acid-binding Zn-ribbon protein